MLMIIEENHNFEFPVVCFRGKLCLSVEYPWNSANGRKNGPGNQSPTGRPTFWSFCITSAGRERLNSTDLLINRAAPLVAGSDGFFNFAAYPSASLSGTCSTGFLNPAWWLHSAQTILYVSILVLSHISENNLSVFDWTRSSTLRSEFENSARLESHSAKLAFKSAL